MSRGPPHGRRSAINPPASGSKRVLIVDDEPSIVIYLTTVLQDNGYDVSSTTDADEALSVARRQCPNLISLDIMMPRRSGIALYQQLKLDPSLYAVPVVFVSAFSRTNDFRPENFRKMVPDKRIPLPNAYLEKPIDVPKFLEVVATLIEPIEAEGVSEEGERA